MPHLGFGFSRKLKIIFLPLLSATCTAIYVAMDKYYLSRISSDLYSYSFLSMWFGLIATAVFMLVMRIPLRNNHFIGSYADPNFRGFILPRGRLLLYLMIAGFSGSFSTLTYFFLVGGTSPSLVLPFTQLVIIYLLVSESVQYKESPTVLEIQSIIMILIGIFLMSTTDRKSVV